MQTKRVPLTHLFAAERGNSKYTKSYGSRNGGDYPVYSAGVQPLTYIDTYDFDGDYLTWNTNGFGGYVTVLREKFSVNGDRGVLRPLRQDIDIEFIAAVLQRTLRSLAVGRRGDRGKNEFTKVSLDTVRKAEVIVPVCEDDPDVFDLEKQRIIASEFRRLADLQGKIRAQVSSMSDMRLRMPIPETTMLISIEDIFDLSHRTNSSKFTRAFVHSNPGTVPVYSASALEDSAGYGHVAEGLPDVKYFEDCLTWNIDGSVGNARFRAGVFSLSEKVIPLVLRDKWVGKIDVEYVKYVLEERSLDYGFSYSNKAGKGRIKDIQIPFPVSPEDAATPDYASQVALAQRFKTALSFQRDVLSSLAALTEVEILPNVLQGEGEQTESL